MNSDDWRDNYVRIAYRKLLGVERDMNFQRIVKGFIASNLGKRYTLSAKKLLGQEDHGFFCSELIA